MIFFSLALVFLLTGTGNADLLHQETHLVILNLARADIVSTNVTSTDGFDWDKNSGPQNNFQGIQIPAGTLYQQQEDVYALALYCYFRMTVTFDDGTHEKYGINMKFAIDKAQANFEHFEGQREVQYMRIGTNTLLIDIRDSGTYCAEQDN